jgi:acylphosphatase
MATIAARLVIAGRVQGVGFRAWTCRQALRRSVRGWVRNRADGSVEALLIGEADAVDAVVEACREGPGMAQVEGVSRIPAEDDGSKSFEERGTA